MEDTTTEVTYTVMIWYTPQFFASFASEADMNVFIDLIFEETNQGYINSQMPVKYMTFIFGFEIVSISGQSF